LDLGEEGDSGSEGLYERKAKAADGGLSAKGRATVGKEDIPR